MKKLLHSRHKSWIMSLLTANCFITASYTYRIKQQIQMAHPSVIEKDRAIFLTFAGTATSYALWSSQVVKICFFHPYFGLHTTFFNIFFFFPNF